MTDEKMVKGYRKSLRQMTDSLYHKQLESIKLASISPTDLVDMLRERDKRIEKLENANTKISAECHKLVDSLEQKQNRIKELEKHNEEIIALIHAERERQEKCDDVHLQRIADLEKENVEMKDKVSYLKDNLRVARKDRENLQLDVAKGLKEFVKDFPATAIRYMANEKYVERFTEAKAIIKDYMIVTMADHCEVCSVPEENRCINVLKLNEQAEQFLKEINK